MANSLRFNVDGVDDRITEYGAGAVLRWERGTAEGGPFVEQATALLVAGQSAYEVFDATGTSTHWYRFRLSNTGNTIQSDYSVAFRGGALNAYASLDDLREQLPGVPDDSQDNLLNDYLVDASAYLDLECDRDFYRHPQVSGTEIRTYHGNGSKRLRVPEGIVSLTGVSQALGTGQAYTALIAADWLLGDPFPDGTYGSVLISDVGAYTAWYSGYHTVQLTGVFGSLTVPPMVRRATLDLAREWYRQGPGGGGPVGVNQFGTPIFGGGMPQTVREVTAKYRAVELVH